MTLILHHLRRYGEVSIFLFRLRLRDLAVRAFGEGLALRDDRLYQLEWKSSEGFIYDLETFDRVGEFRYEGEGWGLAWDGEHFILSDGTSVLRFLKPETFALVRRFEIIGDRSIS